MRASQVAALRRELLGWLDTEDAAAYYEVVVDDPGTWPRREQRAALGEASLFFISDEMTAVAAHAGRSMPDQLPLRDEFPAESGFAVWDGPLVSDEVVSRLVEVHPNAEFISRCHVLSWKLTRVRRYPDERYDGPLDGTSEQAENGLIDAAFLTFWIEPEGRTYPPLIPYHSAVLDLSLPIRESARQDNEGGNEAAGAWIEHFDMAVYTTLVLMGQTVAVVSSERPERAERRRTERAGLDVRDVRVVQLRRAHADTATVDEPPAVDESAEAVPLDQDAPVPVEWQRRWVVRGHWRRQWYASLGEHRALWIHSHVKGPEDRPLVAGGESDVVHALTR